MLDKCIFCNSEDIILQNDLAKAKYDAFPVSEGHILIFTKRCVPTFFDTTREEKQALLDLLEKAKLLLDEKYKPDGYNVGINCGECAGQSINHIHIHLIPRYKGDVENPRGGVRGVIPKKQNY